MIPFNLRSKFLSATAALCILSSLSACTTDQYGNPNSGMAGMGTKQTIGTLGGALGGAAIGSAFGGGHGRIATTAVGTLLGAFIGSSIGSSLDKADQQYAAQAFNQAYSAPVGQSIRWNNPESGNYGNVSTVRDGYSSAGYYCREFQQTIIVGGRSQQANGTACQNPDGTWQIQQ